MNHGGSSTGLSNSPSARYSLLDHQRIGMTPEHSQQELEKRIQQSGMTLSNLTPAQGLRLMLDFYRDVRAEGCQPENLDDMLLVEWGTYNSGEGRSFCINMVRQFTEALTEDEGGASSMTTLSLTFHFPPSAQFDGLQDHHWCSTPDEVKDFERLIIGSEAYRAVATARPQRVTLDYGPV